MTGERTTPYRYEYLTHGADHQPAECPACKKITTLGRLLTREEYSACFTEPDGTLALPLFDAARACPKCGAVGALVHHHTEGYPVLVGPWGKRTDFNSPWLSERMRRTCQRCGYAWDERPLDAEER